MIRVVDLHKSFGGQEVLKGINLELETGKITTIIGGSGSGKTVLPDPLPPMIVVILPVSSSRLIPLSTSWPPKLLCRSTTRIMGLEHDRGHKIVPNQNHDETEHDRFGGRLANSGGHWGRVKSFVTADPCNDQ